MAPIYKKPDVEALKDLATKLRIHSVTSTNTAGSGHPTSCASMADIMSVLWFHSMRYNVKTPLDASSDRFILSKGHACPILYAAWAEAGNFDVKDLQNLRKIDSDLEGHPTPRLPFIDIATGSLGQGLSVACGMAYAGKYFDKAPYRVYCLVGDGETAEGSIWEAIHFAGYYKLNNLCIIVDVNKMGQSNMTTVEHRMETYETRFKSFGVDTIIVDGHDIDALSKAFYDSECNTTNTTALLCKTYKGKDFLAIEDLPNWHGKALGEEGTKIVKYLESKLKNPNVKLPCPKPLAEVPSVNISNIKMSSPPNYTMGDMITTRLAFGNALKKLADNNDRVVGLDGDTDDSTYSGVLKAAHPNRFVECFIAEQNLVGVAIGLACRDRAVAFGSCFSAFMSRAYDQIRMGAISWSNINLVGSHCGISIGEDGAPEMGLEDLALFRSIANSTVFYPSDGVACERAIELAANTKNICYIRTTRPKTPIIYPNDEQFNIGEAKIVKQSPSDTVLVIGAGVTLIEALEAHDKLKPESINIRVMDPFTIKPLDVEGIIKNANFCGGRIVVVEDHYSFGGLGEAVLSALAMHRNFIVKHLAVTDIPRSGRPHQLYEMYGISANCIANAVKEIANI